jgi:hypothetical protein
MQAMGEVLVELNRHVRIEGHTDNVPIATTQFPSNWELSASRAVTVVRTLSERYEVPSQNLSAVGRADSRPQTDNLTPEHRAKNRRVEIVVLERKPEVYPSKQDEERTALELFATPPERKAETGDATPKGLPPALVPQIVPPVTNTPTRTE